jgi:hypothetical protein
VNQKLSAKAPEIFSPNVRVVPLDPGAFSPARAAVPQAAGSSSIMPAAVLEIGM